MALDETVVVNNVTVEFFGKKVLNNISFKCKPGIHVLLGHSGSGKSTLLKVIAGLVKPISGVVYVKGLVPWEVSRRIIAKTVAYTWQNPYYGFLHATVREEIEFILRNTGVVGDRKLVDILVPKWILDRDPFSLSGGEARIVSIASVLVADQDVWLLDEPFNDLDIDGIEKIIEVINYGANKGKTIMIATNSTATIDALDIDKAIVLRNGELVYYGEYSGLSKEELTMYKIVHRGIYCGESF
uniref:ABC transporter ATP-binding protein n=1 Tax=Staphylothermus marinus TaxID=2280 RepID=A0A7C4HEH4_STAMA